MNRTLRAKGFGLVANAVDTIKDDALLAERVREIVKATRDDEKQWRDAINAKTPQPPIDTTPA